MLMKKFLAIALSWTIIGQSLWYVPQTLAQDTPTPPATIQINANSPLSVARSGGSSAKSFAFSEESTLNQSTVNLFQGSANFTLPVQIPQGINGVQPEISLGYNSQAAQSNGMLGFGWGFNSGFIKRLNVNGVDEMYTNPTYYASVGPVQGELILLSTQNGIETYGLRREQSFAKILLNTGTNSWKITTTSGATFELGTSESSRVFETDKTYAWQLEKITDLHGIGIEYEYVRLNSLLYPKRIRYGAVANASNHPFEIRFQPFYDAPSSPPNRLDQHFDYIRGFRTDHKHLLTDIQIWIENNQRLNYKLGYRNDGFRSDLKSFTIQTVGSTPALSQQINLSYYHTADGYSGALFHRQYLLRSVTFPKGGSITWDYLPSNQFITGNAFNERPHFPMTLVSKVSQNDGRGNISTTSYHYQDASFYFESAVEKELAGYGRVTVTDPLNQKVVQYFHQGGGFDGTSLGEAEDSWGLIGQAYRSELFDAQGKMIQRSISHWTSTSISPQRYFISQTSNLSSIFNTSNQSKSTASSSIYDTTNGNLLESIELGEVTGNNNGTFTDLGNDDRKTVISYVTNSNLSAFPSRQQLFDADNQLISEQQTIYDGLPFGSVSKGDTTASRTRFFDENRFITSSATYNENGQPLTSSDPLGNTTVITYDSFSIYPESITNTLGHTQTFTYDLLYGQPVQTEDANGLITKTILDGLGRITAQQATDPNEGNQLVTLQSVEYNEVSFPHSVVSKTHLSETETAESISYLDGLGRVIQTKAEDDGNADQYIVSNTSYDALGRVSKVSLPIFTTGFSFQGGRGASATEEVNTTTTYDTLNRPLTVTDKNGTTTFNYNLWSSTVTDALGNSKTTETDSFGRLVKVVERLEGTEHVTRYDYDSRDLLTKITDANSNIRNFQYDSLGRLKLQEDLHNPSDTDFGTRTYTYDDNSNVLSTTKADGKVINFSYDELNRPLTQVGPSISYTYEYDQGSFGLGKLNSVTGPDHTWSAEYDIRGRVTSESVSLLSTLNPQPLTKSYTYTRFNQPSTITSPNGLVQTYTYNQIGQIKEINSSAGGIITHISYSPLSQVEALSYGNGLRSVFTYDPNQMYRMTQKRTEPASVPVSFQPLQFSITSLSFTNSPIPPFPHFSHFPLLPPPAHAQDFGSLPLEDSQPTIIDDTQDPARDMLEEQLQQRGPTREGQRSERRLNQTRDTSGEVLKPVVTNNGPLPSNLKEKKLIYFQASYENTMVTPSPAVKYQVVVEQNGATVWDSGKIQMPEPVTAGSVSPYVAYELSQLSDGEATWKIAFELEDGTMTPWSDSETFNTNIVPTAPVTQDLQNIKYTYDAAGNITQLSETSGTAATKSAVYEYDDLYRLTSSTITGTIVGEDYVQTQSYDPTGNILNKSGQGNYEYNQSGTTNPQAVSSIQDEQGNNKTFSYDENGNLIQEVIISADGSTLTKNLSWNELDRITSIEVINEAGLVTTISFTYDPSGRRLSKTISNQFGEKTTLYPFADYEITSDGKTKVSISANSMHLATIEHSTSTPDPLQGENPSSVQTRILFSHTDHLGSGNILTDDNGEQVQTLDYYPFGSIRVDEEYQNFDETKKYTGHEFDDESGLYYAQARYYDAEIGRFVSGDPLRWKPKNLLSKFSNIPQAFNTYSYAINNPIILIDPNGESVFEIGLSASFSWLNFGGIVGKGIAWDESGGKAKYDLIGGKVHFPSVVPEIDVNLEFAFKPLNSTVNDLSTDTSSDIEVCFEGCVEIPNPIRAINGTLDEMSFAIGLGSPSIGVEETQKVYQKTRNPDEKYYNIETGEVIRITQPEDPNIPTEMIIEKYYDPPSKKSSSPIQKSSPNYSPADPSLNKLFKDSYGGGSGGGSKSCWGQPC